MSPRVLVVGVGGAGTNAVIRLADFGPEGVALVAVDTSQPTLNRAQRATCVLLGKTGGLGTGGNAAMGAAAAREARSELASVLDGADLVFLVCGLSGGTGGGAGPVIARQAAEGGAIVIGLGFTPFAFEGARRQAASAETRAALVRVCEAMVVLDNERAEQVAGRRVSADVALRVADDVLRQAVQGLSELVRESGLIDVDLSIVKEVLSRGGECCLALGVGRGPAAATKAMVAALESPLVDMSALSAAPAVLVQVTGGPEMTVRDTAEAVGLLRGRLRADCHLVVGTASNPALEQAAEVTVLGTGLVPPPHDATSSIADRYDWGQRMTLAETVRPRESAVRHIEGAVE